MFPGFSNSQRKILIHQVMKRNRHASAQQVVFAESTLYLKYQVSWYTASHFLENIHMPSYYLYFESSVNSLVVYICRRSRAFCEGRLSREVNSLASITT